MTVTELQKWAEDFLVEMEALVEKRAELDEIAATDRKRSERVQLVLMLSWSILTLFNFFLAREWL